jgi:hypothetical protein
VRLCPSRAAAIEAEVSPGTMVQSIPAASQASISSSSRPKTPGSPDFSRTTTSRPPGTVDDHRVDLVLRHGLPEAGLARLHDLGLAARKLEDRQRHEPVVNHHIRFVERAAGTHRQVVRVAGPRAHEQDATLARGLAQMIGEKPVEVRRRAGDEGIEKTALQNDRRARPFGSASAAGRNASAVLTIASQRRGQLLLEMRLDLPRQYRGRAFGADGHDQRIAVDDRGRQERAVLEVVDDVEGRPPLRRAPPRGRPQPPSSFARIDEPRARDLGGRHGALGDGKASLRCPVPDRRIDFGRKDLDPGLGLEQ